MGALLAEHFVSAHQQVGDFEVVSVNGELQRNGGNVASYFCTPEGRVVHAVAGPVSADELLAETRWALEKYSAVRDQPLHRLAASLAREHLTAAGEASGTGKNEKRSRQIHLLLAQTGLPPLQVVHSEVFVRILGQKLGESDADVAMSGRLLAMARREGKPVLFVFHKREDNAQGMRLWLSYQAAARQAGLPLRPLLQDYVVVVLPLRGAPALSRELGLPPFEFTSTAEPLMVVCRDNGTQIGSASGSRQADSLVNSLARGWVDAIRRDPPPIGRLRAIARLMRKIDRTLWQQLVVMLSVRQKASDQDGRATDERLLADADVPTRGADTR